jgi:hypothetical protein
MATSSRRPQRQTKRNGKSNQKSNEGDYGEGDSEEDPLEELTRPQLLEINRVFDAIVSGSSLRQKPTSTPLQDKTAITNPAGIQTPQQTSPGDQGGGFIVEDEETFQGGGFFIEDESSQRGFEAGGFLTEDAGSEAEAGGFLPEEPEAEVEAGGFMTEETTLDVKLDQPADYSTPRLIQNPDRSTSSQKVSNYIDIRRIPDALKMLNLPHRNSEILDIFENAASSDEDEQSDQRARSYQRKEKLISRMKFSKVCAVLMMTNGNDDNSGTDEIDGTDQDNRRKERVEEDEDYDIDQGSSDQASSASDYRPDPPQDGPSIRNRTRRSGNQTPRSRTSAASECDPSDVISAKARRKRRQAKGKKRKASSEVGADEDEDDVPLQNSALETFALFLEPTTMNSDVR